MLAGAFSNAMEGFCNYAKPRLIGHVRKRLDESLFNRSPNDQVTNAVDILAGNEICAQILEGQLRRGKLREPQAKLTRLGWVLSGLY